MEKSGNRKRLYFVLLCIHVIIMRMDKTYVNKNVKLLFFVLLIVLVGFISAGVFNDNKDDTKVAAAPVADIVTKHAKTFCDKHTKTTTTADFLKDEGYPVKDDSRAWTIDECNKIIEKLYTEDENEKHIEGVANHQIFIGMTQKQLIYSIGNPYNVNTATKAESVTDQYAYDSGNGKTSYIYIENGRVTTIQD